MKVSPLNLKKSTDVNKMRVYIRLAFSSLLILLDIGWLLPILISSKSGCLVMLGFVLVILTIPFAYYAYRWSVKTD
jgi:NADH:ubiquinone oxidoreductase subunit 3 (subunit A)